MPCKMAATILPRGNIFFQSRTCPICLVPALTMAQHGKLQSAGEGQLGQGCDFFPCPDRDFQAVYIKLFPNALH